MVHSNKDIKRLEFYSQLKKYLKDNKISLEVKLHKGNSSHWAHFTVGRVRVSTDLVEKDNKIRVNLYMVNARPIYDELYKNKGRIEKSLSFRLEWRRECGRTASRIKTYIYGLNFANTDKFPELIHKTVNYILQFIRAFEPVFEDLGISYEKY